MFSAPVPVIAVWMGVPCAVLRAAMHALDMHAGWDDDLTASQVLRVSRALTTADPAQVIKDMYAHVDRFAPEHAQAVRREVRQHLANLRY